MCAHNRNANRGLWAIGRGIAIEHTHCYTFPIATSYTYRDPSRTSFTDFPPQLTLFHATLVHHLPQHHVLERLDQQSGLPRLRPCLYQEPLT
jgi:hypothetical protein